MRKRTTGNTIKITRTKKPNYRSKLEERVAEQLTRAKVGFEYEAPDKRIEYHIPKSVHYYTPDFIIEKADNSRIYIEVKGIWDYDDRYKHYLIRKQHPGLDIRFVFQRAGNKIRKGSKSTYGDICNGNGRGIFKGVMWKFSDNGKLNKEWINE